MVYTDTIVNGKIKNTVRRFVVDTTNDLPEIDVSQLSPGSIAYIVDIGARYMLNNQFKWILQPSIGGGSGGTNPDNEYIYDGGMEVSDHNMNTYIYDGGMEI